MKKAIAIIISALVVALSSAAVGCSSDGRLKPEPEPTQSRTEVAAFAGRITAEVSVGTSSGTGFIIDAEDGVAVIATCYHLSGYDYTRVYFRFGGHDEFVPARALVGYDAALDVAFFSVGLPEGASSVIGSQRERTAVPSVGEDVLAYGNAAGAGLAAFDGIVSSKSEVARSSGRDKPVLRVTAAIDAGMSGAPVLDDAGRVVGMALGRADGTQSIGYMLHYGIVRALYDRAKLSPGCEISRMAISFASAEKTIDGVMKREVSLTVSAANGLKTIFLENGKMTMDGAEVSSVAGCRETELSLLTVALVSAGEVEL